KTNVILGRKVICLYGNEYITDTIGDLSFRISPLAFFQINPEQTEKLYAKALEYAGLTSRENVWDLYCGSGTISLFLARQAALVRGVEIVPAAIENAEENARLNGIENALFFCGEAEKIFPEWAQEEDAQADVVVVDPPRKGCDVRLLEAIIKVAPDRIVYVSCDPATLARDVKILSDGGYKLVKAQPVDMFPHTVHVETVVLMTKIQIEK
ncbi:MAG: 23S rRNA (uracil(1939)-C(5))-methyltransferase RlmD, partial [Lachnospiraceae bacterium]|nr:23S rRNA (uracil(1939)-C(5))-methyltransferase RlmD [Lachnospiraceae bacterium]